MVLNLFVILIEEGFSDILTIGRHYKLTRRFQVVFHS